MRKILILLLFFIFLENSFSQNSIQNYGYMEGGEYDVDNRNSFTYSIYYPKFDDWQEYVEQIFEINKKNLWDFIFGNSDKKVTDSSLLVSHFFISNQEVYLVSFLYWNKKQIGWIKIEKLNLLTGTDIVIYKSENAFDRTYNSYYQEYEQICKEYILKY